MKIVYISPHLSTGGCPQFLLKKIQMLHKDHEVHCIEYADHGRFTVQKNQIRELLGERLYRVNDRREEILEIIERVQPDVVHLEEMPEYFMDNSIAIKLYSKDRKYKLIETSHDSSFDPKNKKFFPDRFIFVSKFQEETMKVLGIPSEVCEYPIGIIPRKPRNEALKMLGLDPNKKHVIHVGLFTPRKNQAEVIEYAKKLISYPIQFHFIGNQADNFKGYWEPLMNNFPSNCKWWDERKDVDNFYQAADLFLFTSRGSVTDKETSPLVIREAISYNIPSLIYNLPVYLGMYDKYDNIEYLDFDSQEKNLNKILNILNMGNTTFPELIEEPKKKIGINGYPFHARWDINEQKMSYSCSTRIDFPIIVALKEYKSNAVMWSVEYQNFPENCEYWMIPISKNACDYSKYEFFSGIKLCIYKKDTQEQLYECPFFNKFVNMPTVTLSNRAPYYMNYLEYFMQGKYSQWFDGRKKFHTAVDVGANIGVFTEFLIKNKISRKVISVECDSVALKDLQENYEFNDNVKVIGKALSDTTNPIVFYQCPDNSIISSTISPANVAHHRAGLLNNKETTVQAITVKELVDEAKQIDLLKIDIEGAEYKVFENMDPELSKYINNMFIECHFFEADYKEKYEKLLNKLKSMGYTVEEAITKPVEEYAGSSECIFATRL